MTRCFVSLDTEGDTQAMPVKVELKEALRQITDCP